MSQIKSRTYVVIIDEVDVHFFQEILSLLKKIKLENEKEKLSNELILLDQSKDLEYLQISKSLMDNFDFLKYLKLEDNPVENLKDFETKYPGLAKNDLREIVKRDKSVFKKILNYFK